MNKYYLAGPDVFFEDGIEQLNKKKDLLNSYGFEGLIPSDLPSNSPYIIFNNNLSLIEQATGIIANISPFRGPHCDNGTAFELGYAYSLNKDIYLYTANYSELKTRIDTNSFSNFGERVEDFGFVDNLMISLCSNDFKVYKSFKDLVESLYVLEGDESYAKQK